MTESIGAVYPTQVPALSDPADIQEALRVYHYGATTGSGAGEYDPNNSNPDNLFSNSIAFYLNDLQDQVTNLGTVKDVTSVLWTDKGVLLSSSDVSTTEALTVGTDGQHLVANSSTSTGLEWSNNLTSPVLFGTLSSETGTDLVLAPDSSIVEIRGDGASDQGGLRLNSELNNFGQTLRPQPESEEAINTLTLPTGGNQELVGVVAEQQLFNKSFGDSVEVVGNVTYNLEMRSSGFVDSYTLAIEDQGSVLQVDRDTDNDIIIPLESNVDFPIGTQIVVLQAGEGQTSIIPEGAGVTINATPGFSLRDQWSSATVIKRASDLWVVIGDLVV